MLSDLLLRRWCMTVTELALWKYRVANVGDWYGVPVYAWHIRHQLAYRAVWVYPGDWEGRCRAWPFRAGQVAWALRCVVAAESWFFGGWYYRAFVAVADWAGLSYRETEARYWSEAWRLLARHIGLKLTGRRGLAD